MDEDFGKLVVRLTVGVLMLFHGVHKVLTGIDPIKHMVAAQGLPDLPIVALTGKVVAGERQRCIEAGAHGYVPKPVNTVELIAAITPWLRNTLESV